LEQLPLLFDEYELKSFCSSITFKDAKRQFRKYGVQNFKLNESTLSGQSYDENKKGFDVSVVKTDRGLSGYCSCHESIKMCQHAVTLCLGYLEAVSARKTGLDQVALADDGDRTLMTITIDRIQLRLEFNHLDHDYSLYFSDRKSGRVLDEAFFFLHPPDELVLLFDDPLKQWLLDCLADFGPEFFLPRNFYSLETEAVILHDLLLSDFAFAADGRAYAVTDAYLDFQLKFGLDGDSVQFHANWLSSIAEAEIPLQSGSLVWGSPPVFVTQNLIYKIRKDVFFTYAKSFVHHPSLSLDIEKFIATIRAKGEEFKGALIKMDKALQTLSAKKLNPKPCLQLKQTLNQKLILRVFFQYGGQSLVWNSPKKHLLDLDKNIFYKRDLGAEASYLRPFLQFSHKKRGGLLIFSSPEKWEVLVLLSKKKTWDRCFGASVLHRFKLAPKKIQARLKIQASKNDHYDVALTFRLGKKDLPMAINKKIFLGHRFIELADGQVYAVDFTETVQFLMAMPGKWSEEARLIDLNLGQMIAVIQREPDLCDARQEEIDMALKLGLTSLQKMSGALYKKLHRYQKEGVHWLLALRHYGLSGILADDMGLGKTVQALALIDALKREEKIALPILIVMPKTLLFNWEAELEKFLPQQTAHRYEGPHRKQVLKRVLPGDLLLMSYHSMRLDIAELKGILFEYVILDEGQFIKNPGSKSAKAASALNANHRLVLTGTPVENRPNDIWSLFHFLSPGYLPKLPDFVQRYDKPIRQGDMAVLDQLKMTVSPFSGTTSAIVPNATKSKYLSK